MTARDILMAAGGASQEKLYVDDVFSTYLYTGNGAFQGIYNGIDLEGKGGMVWIKLRKSSGNNNISDTARGTSRPLRTNQTSAQQSAAAVAAFISNGFNLNTFSDEVNGSGSLYTSWTFRKAPKFFDVVTYTGDGSTNRTIPHGLGIEPGLITAKSISVDGDWNSYHRAASGDLVLNSTAAQAASRATINEASNATFTVSGNANLIGITYVAYMFAHDPSADGLIQCGSFTTDASGNATISLGWEPQFVLLKASSTVNGWIIVDSMRGMPVGGADAQLYPHVSNAEASINTLDPTATGFNATGLTANATFIYMAIRRRNKPPASGTQVFKPSTRTGGSGGTSTLAAGFPVDLVITKNRTSSSLTGARYTDRLRGITKWLDSSAATLETATADTVTGLDSMFGMTLGLDNTTKAFNATSVNYVDYFFRRAPGFMDIVCYPGSGTAMSINHNLGAIPELIIVKSRSTATGWQVYFGFSDRYLVLNTAAAQVAGNIDLWTWFAPSSNVFNIGTNTAVNSSGSTYVAYLFSTMPGISKVGSYTGNGGSQEIDCGFSNGARFVLIKRIDAQSSWYVWDTARGITSGTDPYFKLNSTAAEETAEDAIDPAASGFIINQDIGSNMNVSGGQYIFLAIA